MRLSRNVAFGQHREKMCFSRLVLSYLRANQSPMFLRLLEQLRCLTTMYDNKCLELVNKRPQDEDCHAVFSTLLRMSFFSSLLKFSAANTFLYDFFEYLLEVPAIFFPHLFLLFFFQPYFFNPCSPSFCDSRLFST